MNQRKEMNDSLAQPYSKWYVTSSYPKGTLEHLNAIPTHTMLQHDTMETVYCVCIAKSHQEQMICKK